jgi:polysaccharide export outer membrane protein
MMFFELAKLFKHFLLLATLALSGQIILAQQVTSDQPTSVGIPATESHTDSTYRLGPADVLEIRVFNRPQLTRDSVRIDERGMIQMPLIEVELQASCRTTAELAKDIATRYAKYIRNPQVDVFVKEYQSQPVAVVGAVNAPGRFQLRRSVRLLDLLTFAGGPSEKGGRQVHVVHAEGSSDCSSPSDSGGAAESLEAFDLRETLRGDPNANPIIRPGDVVTVPEAEQAFIVGNVFHPTTIPLKEPITITQAIAMAGGAMPDTKTDRIRLVRHTASGKNIIFVDLKAIANRQSEDFPLVANDVVEVPVSGGRRFLRTLTGTIGPAAARIPIRVIP